MESIIQKLNPFIWDYPTWRKFFLISALWNFSGGIPAACFPALNMKLFYGISTSNFMAIHLNFAFWVTVILFGIGYLMIAYSPFQNRGLVILGILGKSLVAIGWYYLYIVDRATIVSVLAGTGDLIFTVYFIIYMIRAVEE